MVKEEVKMIGVLVRIGDQIEIFKKATTWSFDEGVDTNPTLKIYNEKKLLGQFNEWTYIMFQDQ